MLQTLVWFSFEVRNGLQCRKLDAFIRGKCEMAVERVS